ncbi:MAG: hypothetical protein A2Z94_00270 [Gallionellales bacterium GWA2_55_18]|nr:MAG: hypothetical protein A2Z94_00270 [Gallionellales bacterium GWA2_55_18]
MSDGVISESFTYSFKFDIHFKFIMVAVVMTATFDEFTEAFIAALVEKGVVVLDPNAERTNQGFERIYELLSARATQANTTEERRWYTRLRNNLAPSNIGTFDYFLAALRSCQLGFASSPNPRYSELSFKVSKPQAEDFLSHIDESLRDAAETAADAFLSKQEEFNKEFAKGGGVDHVYRGHQELTP